MKRAATIGLALVALAVPASASADTTATILGANINAKGTQVSVTNVQVKFDSCGGYDPYVGFGGCGALAGVVPASVTCPADAGGVQELWRVDPVGYGSGGVKTFDSGAQSVAVSAPVAHRVCAYSIVSNSGGSILPASQGDPILRADAVTPAPTPPPKLIRRSKATSISGSLLKKKYGKRWTKGTARHNKCKLTGSDDFRCDVSWNYEQKHFAGFTIVDGDRSAAHKTDKVKVKSHKRHRR